MELEALKNNKKHALKVREVNGRYIVNLDGNDYTVDFCEPEESFYSLLVDGKSYEVSINSNENEFTVYLYDSTHNFRLYDPARNMMTSGKEENTDGPQAVRSPMPGRIVRILVNQDDSVKKGDGVIIVEAMKMENELKSPKDGTVEKISVKQNDTVESNQILLTVT